MQTIHNSHKHEISQSSASFTKRKSKKYVFQMLRIFAVRYPEGLYVLHFSPHRTVLHLRCALSIHSAGSAVTEGVECQTSSAISVQLEDDSRREHKHHRTTDGKRHLVMPVDVPCQKHRYTFSQGCG